jgi:hypothetical protein
VWHELSQSRKSLERHLGRPVHSLAYPYGVEDADVVAAARGTGYALAFTTRPGDTQSAAGLLVLHRIEIHRNVDLARIPALLHSGS